MRQPKFTASLASALVCASAFAQGTPPAAPGGVDYTALPPEPTAVQKQLEGVKVSMVQAVEAAEEAGMDLVEIVSTSEPPVAKILDYGKHRFQEQKKKAEQRKRQKVVELKEIKLRPNIDTHDYEVKAKAMHRFFDEGDKVKVTLRFRGREMAHPELGMKLLNKVQADFDEIAKVEFAPKMEGRQMIMILAPR